jgi:hypothetical protein
MDLSFKLRKAREHSLQALPASGQILDAGRSDEAGGAGNRSGRKTSMRRQFDQNPSCLDALTLRSARAMLNCTEVISRHRNGCTGYTKVCDRPAVTAT